MHLLTSAHGCFRYLVGTGTGTGTGRAGPGIASASGASEPTGYSGTCICIRICIGTAQGRSTAGSETRQSCACTCVQSLMGRPMGGMGATGAANVSLHSDSTLHYGGARWLDVCGAPAVGTLLWLGPSAEPPSPCSFDPETRPRTRSPAAPGLTQAPPHGPFRLSARPAPLADASPVLFRTYSARLAAGPCPALPCPALPCLGRGDRRSAPAGISPKTLAMGVSGEALWTAGPLGTNRSSSGTRGFDKSRLSRPRRPVWSARIGVRVDHGDGIPCSPRASTCAFASSRIQQAPPAVPALRSHWAVFTKHTGTARLHATHCPTRWPRPREYISTLVTLETRKKLRCLLCFAYLLTYPKPPSYWPLPLPTHERQHPFACASADLPPSLPASANSLSLPPTPCPPYSHRLE
ncbi:hypothetical protein J3E74DRAFT_289521 [Bipolaris maydis]|nr:hypothetical protein J3E74DRAFT_289521 [Bipolaris maydis]